MLVHLNSTHTLVLDGRGSIWLQLLRQNDRPCCSSFGVFTHRLDAIIDNVYPRHSWCIYLLPGEADDYAWFSYLWLVHEARRDVSIPMDAMLLYRHGCVYRPQHPRQYGYSPAEYITLGATSDWYPDLWRGHTHVLMFYPFYPVQVV